MPISLFKTVAAQMMGALGENGNLNCCSLKWPVIQTLKYFPGMCSVCKTLPKIDCMPI